MGFLDPVKGFGVTFGMMFKKVATEEYPEAGAPAAPRYHGRHQLNRHPEAGNPLVLLHNLDPPRPEGRRL